MNASADGDIHDYWTNTPAYDALTLIGDSDVGVAVGIAGIIVAAYVAYSTAHSPKPSASKLFGNGVIAALAAGLSSYMLLVQIVSFDVAHWLNSFTGPLVTVHGMLFSAICAFTLQASSMSHVKAPKVAHVVFYLVGVIAFAVGFCASLLVLGFLATSKDTNLVEWLCLLGIFVGVIAIGYVTRLIARFTLDKKAGSRTSKGKAKDGSRGVVLKALGRTATMFVVFEIALRLIGGTLADSGPIYEFTEATAKQDDYSSRVVKLNVMLRTKHEKYVTESGETYETIEYGYDSYGVNNYVVGRDENGLIYLVSSSKLEEFKDHITVLKALYWAPNHSKSIRTHKLGSDGEVVRVCKKYLNNDTEAEHWIYSTR
ncbi:MAG: hypothetical protein IJ087_11595, partial [Eggerthellaceae bacterium]|nr:hypothetical protein [Eggerthellaceae bacterium]